MCVRTRIWHGVPGLKCKVLYQILYGGMLGFSRSLLSVQNGTNFSKTGVEGRDFVL